jgi:hypothetical protein
MKPLRRTLLAAVALALLGAALTAQAPPKQEDPTVFVTKTGDKYHKDGCRSLARSKIPMKLREAVKQYGACLVCKPPVPEKPANKKG